MTKGADRKDGEGLFTKRCHYRIRGNGFKQKEDSFRPDVRKKLFPVTVVGHWKRLSQSACECLHPGRVQGQAGQCSVLPGIVKGAGRGAGKR